MKPIKVNFKKSDGTKTSTTLASSACKMFAQVMHDVKLSDFDNIDDYYSRVARVAQDFVNDKNKVVNDCDLDLHKDFIEDSMLYACMSKIKRDNGR
jgi:hypothetical protein